MVNSTDDKPGRKKDFNEFKKLMLDMNTGDSTVGSIMGAMVYQISQQKEKMHEEATKSKPKTPQNVKKELKKERSSKGTPEDSNFGLDSMFDDLMQNMAIEHAIKETDFQHIFSYDKVMKGLKSSPYMNVKDENDQIQRDADAFNFPDG